jgi:hypothetical protein
VAWGWCNVCVLVARLVIPGCAAPNSGLPEFGYVILSKSATADLDGAGPESITTIGRMDSGLALTRAPE